MKRYKFIIILLACIATFTLNAQEKKVIDTSCIDINELPEYIVITSENTKLLGGINITIDAKKSIYQDVLENLEHILQNRKKLHIRNQTDLMNALYQLGYEFLDAYNASAGTIGAGTGNDVSVFGSDAKYRINMVFKKKRH